MDPRLSFSRASGATYWDATGTLKTALTNAPRIDYGPNPGGVTNWIANSTMAGAATGSPGTLPTGWGESHNTGITPKIVGVGVESGLPYVDIQLSGTATTGNNNIYLSPAGVASAYNGQSWNLAIYLRIVGGSTANIASVDLIVGQQNSHLVSLGDLNTNIIGSLTANPLSTQRLSFPTVTNQPSVSFVAPSIKINPAAAGPINLTLRIGAPQLSPGTSASAWIPTSGTPVNSGAVPLGLLLEDQRTNSLLYSTAFSNAAWYPTNDGGSVTANVARSPDNTVSACLFTENTAAGEHLISQSLTTSGQQAVSVYARYNGRFLVIRKDGSGTGPFAVFDVQNGLVTSVGSGAQAYIQPCGFGWFRCVLLTTMSGNVVFKLSSTGTVTNAGAGGQADYTGNGTSGIYLWQAQCEGGLIATSPIFTTTTTVTRAEDVRPIISLGSWFNHAQGTFALEAILPALGDNPGLLTVSDGTIQNRLTMYDAGSTLDWQSTISGSASQTLAPGTLVAGTPFKLAGTYTPSSIGAAVNGQTPVTGVSSIPPVLTQLALGGTNEIARLNGYIRRVRYWPRALRQSQLKQVTT